MSRSIEIDECQVQSINNTQYYNVGRTCIQVNTWYIHKTCGCAYIMLNAPSLWRTISRMDESLPRMGLYIEPYFHNNNNNNLIIQSLRIMILILGCWFVSLVPKRIAVVFVALRSRRHLLNQLIAKLIWFCNWIWALLEFLSVLKIVVSSA